MDELDRILAHDPAVAPPARFAANVMAAVRREADTPPAIAFPWRRAIPGVVVCGGALAIVLLQAISSWAPAPASRVAPLAEPASAALALPLGWGALALVGAFLVVRAVVRLAEMPD